jgi:hypothetical protein
VVSPYTQEGNDLRIDRRTIADAYRCPEEFGSFSVIDNSSKDPGYFRFGKDTICYGRSSRLCGGTPTGALQDLLEDIVTNGGIPALPFDPAEVIDNLRLECYVKRSRSAKEKALFGGYYFLRPLMPVWFRRHLQKLRLRRSRDLPFPKWPMDCTVERIQERLLALAMRASDADSVPFIWFWPDRARSCAIITHDVETITGLEFCPALMDIEDSFGMKSSFQLVPEKRYSLSERIVEGIRGRGFEVNIHDLNHDGHLYSERNEFRRRAKRINEYGRRYNARGFRSGALHRNLEWYDALEFDYDMSVPNAGHLEAQAGGCCTVRPYFIGDMVELPLTTTQDYSLFHILGDYSIRLWKEQIDALVERNGLVSFIVHPDYIIEKKAQDTYRSLLGYLAELRDQGKLSIALPNEVATWWRQRSRASLTCRNGQWRIAEPGLERACVARAYSDGEQVCYSV